MGTLKLLEKREEGKKLSRDGIFITATPSTPVATSVSFEGRVAAVEIV